MSDSLKSWAFWIAGTLIVLFKDITIEDVVYAVQILAFTITIAYTLWKWKKDKRRINNQNISTNHEGQNNGRKKRSE